MKKRNLSILSKIVAFIWVTFWATWTYINTGSLTTEQGWGIIQIGLFIALLFSPVDISVWIDKFLGKKDDAIQ